MAKASSSKSVFFHRHDIFFAAVMSRLSFSSSLKDDHLPLMTLNKVQFFDLPLFSLPVESSSFVFGQDAAAVLLPSHFFLLLSAAACEHSKISSPTPRSLLLLLLFHLSLSSSPFLSFTQTGSISASPGPAAYPSARRAPLLSLAARCSPICSFSKNPPRALLSRCCLADISTCEHPRLIRSYNLSKLLHKSVV